MIRGEHGMSLVEVLIALMVTSFAILGTFQLIDGALKTSHAAQREVQVVAYAQREMERLRGLPWADLGHDLAPTHEADATPGDPAPSTPAHYVSGTNFLVRTNYADRASGPPTGVLSTGEPLVNGGAVSGLPETVNVAGTTGRLFRFITWRDERCAVVGLVADTCTATRESKRITVAISLDPSGNGGGPRKPVYVTTVVSDPTVTPIDLPAT